MKATKTKTHRISFQEKTSKGFVDRSFDTPKEHLEWHLLQMKKSTDVGDGFSQKSEPLIRGVSFRSI